MRVYQRLVLGCVLLTTACGGGGEGANITGPTNQIPSVAGNYSGTTSITFPEIPQTATCPTTTSVTQSSGGNINIAPLQLRGECGTLSIPVGPTTINATGSLGSENGTISESCGTYNYSGSGGFFGRDMRISFVYTSRTCYNMNLTINLTRQ